MSDRAAPPPTVVPVLLVALAAVSGAGVLVRLLPDLPAPTVALWRCALVALVLAPTLRPLARRDLLLSVLAGLALALHFWAWFESLRHTSVLRSTVLVCLSPVWTALFERLALGHRTTGRYWLGVGVALLGVGGMALTGGVDAEGGARGDLLAVVGGALAGAYFVLGRSVRQRVGIGAYGALVSGAAAAWLLPVVLLVLPASGTAAPLWGYTPRTWLLLAALALGPQLLGHVGMAYAVRFLPAAVVSLVVLLEPAGAAVLARLVLGEQAAPGEWLGAVVIVLGVATATVRWERLRR